jgi:3-oxoacyl-(acyl-carrier-protein) synthase
MDVFISGAGWITPQGDDLAKVWDAVLAGTPAPVSDLPGLNGYPAHTAACIPPRLVDAVARQPRLRRSSNISLFAAAAALAALRDAGIDPPGAGNCALVCAVSDGGVIYTRKFYDQVVRQGSGSPLLFPETVYNAPTSHIAALLGLDGSTYTVVGDASAGLSAISLAAELLATTAIDHCIVAAAEEADWILCEAYRQWRLTTDRRAIEIGANRGALLADGAAAIVLSRKGPYRLDIAPAIPFFRRSEASSSLAAALACLPNGTKPGGVISCANGTFIDRAERSAIKAAFGPLRTLYPKVTLGDPFGAGALMQIIGATQELRRGTASTVLVPVIGLNEQAGASLVSTSV